MRVMFLDIDGVLNSTRSATALGGYPSPRILPGDGIAKFDMVALGLIKILLKEVPDTKVVISSTWRIAMDAKEIGDLLGIEVYDATPVSMDMRGHEINNWLSSQYELGVDIESYTIIDDDSDMLESQMSRFVKVDGKNGFSWENYVKARDLLRGNYGV